jgi:hypothetical protein
LFIARKPSAKGTNSEAENVAGFALSLEEGFEVVIFQLFTGSSFLQGFRTILEWTTDVNDGNMVLIGDDNVRSDW